jgi:hypothetical protein
MFDLILVPPKNNVSKPTFRRGFTPPVTSYVHEYISAILPPSPPPIVYEVSKLTHNGIIGFKRFEGVNRKVSSKSFENLLSSSNLSNETLSELVLAYKNATSDAKRSAVNNKAIVLLNQEGYDLYLVKTHQSRNLNAAQSRKVRKMSEKLNYYTATRKFTSKKTGQYSMKIAFLTLTTPSNASPQQSLSAFTKFLEYLHRTANCHYVWKKELGDESMHLHYHIVINNFIPYYIVSWKWKRLLIGEGVSFSSSDSNHDTNAHSRIELPKSAKQVSHYISKYMSKAYELPGDFGYIAGFSQILNKLPELIIEPDNILTEDIRNLMKISKVIKHDYVSIICVDLLKVKDKFPNLFSVFEVQYLANSDLVTLPQKFNSV